ncbi:hypothetical protein C0J52_04658 [Blattella germanica]|nr:hypothetical protein C0J52_04658 [Blattella germanica]
MANPKPKLRIITYMCPSHPVELYELILQYLEEEVGCEASLLYESRGPGPLADRFMTASAYVKLLDGKHKYVELLPVAAVYDHPKNKEGVKGYYSDIIIHVDGHGEDSLSGSTVILKNLKELGENASFFGNTLRSGSHLNSVHMVLTKQAEAAAVDANTLAYNKKYLQDGGKDIMVLDSIGPLPPYPIVVNSKMDGKQKTKITQAILKMPETRLWGSRLKKFGIIKFVSNSQEAYDKEKEIRDAVKNVSLGPRYY